MTGGLRRLRYRVLRRLVHVRRHPQLGEVWGIVDGVVGDAVRDHTLIYGAAVAFFTLLSLIPLLILFASAGGFVLHSMGGDSAGELEELLGEVMFQLKKAIPFMGERLEQDLRLIVQNRGGLGLIGFGFLALSSSQVFRALEFAFARIFARGRRGLHPSQQKRVVDDRHTKPRSYVASKLLFAVFLFSLIGVFLAFRIALRVLSKLTAPLPDPVHALFDDPLGGDSLSGHLLSGSLVVFGFWAVIRFFSPHRIRSRYSIVGGVIFAAVWQVSREVFEVYLERWSQLGAIYGGFSALMASVLWIFFSAMLLLLCAHLVWTLQRRVRYGPRYGRKPDLKRPSGNTGLPRPADPDDVGP